MNTSVLKVTNKDNKCTPTLRLEALVKVILLLVNQLS